MTEALFFHQNIWISWCVLIMVFSQPLDVCAIEISPSFYARNIFQLLINNSMELFLRRDFFFCVTPSMKFSNFIVHSQEMKKFLSPSLFASKNGSKVLFYSLTIHKMQVWVKLHLSHLRKFATVEIKSFSNFEILATLLFFYFYFSTSICGSEML